MTAELLRVTLVTKVVVLVLSRYLCELAIRNMLKSSCILNPDLRLSRLDRLRVNAEIRRWNWLKNVVLLLGWASYTE